MYLILLSNRLWYRADTMQEVNDFIKVIRKNDNKIMVLKGTEKDHWETIKIDKDK